MNPHVAWIIAAVVLANIAGALWLMWWTSHGSTAPAAANSTTHVWDEDLTEYNNPLPRWWLWLFILSIVFALGYLVYFPGIWRGTDHWSSVGQWKTEQQAADAAFNAHFAGIKGMNLVALSQDPSAMATARNLFALNCSTCHGSDARGAKGFPNLTDHDWLWGGDPDTIYQTIALGRQGMMPAWGPVLGSDGVNEVEAYVFSLSGRQVDAKLAAAGKVRFDTLCVACHGPDGKGTIALGAPNLTDNIWLHGGSDADVRETITNGRTNRMPAHLERLGETKVRLLAAYIYSLSAADKTASLANGNNPDKTAATDRSP
jgi:cytochrome c oxidase cbb3-type subunit 3